MDVNQKLFGSQCLFFPPFLSFFSPKTFCSAFGNNYSTCQTFILRLHQQHKHADSNTTQRIRWAVYLEGSSVCSSYGEEAQLWTLAPVLIMVAQTSIPSSLVESGQSPKESRGHFSIDAIFSNNRSGFCYVWTRFGCVFAGPNPFTVRELCVWLYVFFPPL